MSIMGNTGKAAKRRTPTAAGGSSMSLLGNKNNQKKKKKNNDNTAKTGNNNPLTVGNYMKTVYKDQMTDKPKANKWANKIINSKWNAQNNANYQQAQDYINQYANRPDFSYDVNKDMLYQQYKNQYINNAQEAMRDTIARQNAANGGYGTSYGATAAQQQYQKNLEGLNNVIPQLYEAAYNKYQDKGAQLMNSANLYNTMYGLDKDAYDTDLARKQAIQSIYENRRISGAQTLGDLATANRAFKYQKKQDKQAQKNWERQFNATQAARSASRGGGGSSGGGRSGYTSSYTGSTYKGKGSSGAPKLTNMTTQIGSYTKAVYVTGKGKNAKYWVEKGSGYAQISKPRVESVQTGYWDDVNTVAKGLKPISYMKGNKVKYKAPSASKVRAAAKAAGINVDNATVAAIQKSVVTGKTPTIKKGKKKSKKK